MKLVWCRYFVVFVRRISMCGLFAWIWQMLSLRLSFGVQCSILFFMLNSNVMLRSFEMFDFLWCWFHWFVVVVSVQQFIYFDSLNCFLLRESAAPFPSERKGFVNQPLAPIPWSAFDRCILNHHPLFRPRSFGFWSVRPHRFRVQQWSLNFKRSTLEWLPWPAVTLYFVSSTFRFTKLIIIIQCTCCVPIAKVSILNSKNRRVRQQFVVLHFEFSILFQFMFCFNLNFQC